MTLEEEPLYIVLWVLSIAYDLFVLDNYKMTGLMKDIRTIDRQIKDLKGAVDMVCQTYTCHHSFLHIFCFNEWGVSWYQYKLCIIYYKIVQSMCEAVCA